MDDIKACFTGLLFSVLGSSWLGVVQDVLTAFVLGAIGALGGWIINRLMNRFFPKKK